MPSPLVYLTCVVVLGIAAQWIAWRIRLPAILLLLIFGFAFGWQVDPDHFIDETMLFPIVSLSVAVILFEGGLSLRFSELRETGQVVTRLITVGGLVTFILSTLAARLIFENIGICALAGAVFVVTGPTVIVPLLRHVRPVRRIGAIAKWEGIVNDPIGAVLALLVFETVSAVGVREAAFGVTAQLFKIIAISGVLGVVLTFALIEFFRRHWIPDYLQNPVLLAVVLGSFTASNVLQPESGLATVTLLGILLANQKRIVITHLVEFKENLGVLLISMLFILLASRLRLEDVTELGWAGAGFLALLILVVRPASIFLATVGTTLSWQERVFLSCLAPRGIVAAAVASVFALELSHASRNGLIDPSLAQQAEQLVPLTFLVIIGTVAIYGLAAAPLARRLHIADSNPQGILFAGADGIVRAIAKLLQSEGFQVLLVDTNYDRISQSRMAGLPVCHASVLSEYVREEIELGGIGRLLAMTGNDEVNSLACLQFIESFGRSNVYQLAPRVVKSATRAASNHSSLRGRTLFGAETTHAGLAQVFAAGGVVKKTSLTEEFDYAAFRQQYGTQATVLFVIDQDENLKVCVDDENEFATGQTLISLVEAELAQSNVAASDLREPTGLDRDENHQES